MKLAFLFDARFTKHGDRYYSTNLSQEFWNSRYLKVFDEIVVVGRYVETAENPSHRLVLSSNAQVSFQCLPDTSRLRRIFTQRQQKAFIADAIRDCDRVVCRGWWGVDVCQKLGKPYMVEVVSCVWDSYWNHSFMGKLVALPNFLLQRRAVKNAPYVLYVTREFLQRRYPTAGKSAAISDVELQEVPNQDSVLARRLQKIDTHPGKLVIGTAGSLAVEYKGQRFVIRALARLKKQGKTDIEYQMAGGGNPEKLLRLAQECGVEDQIRIVGSIPHENIFSWYDQLDLYIQPSLQEGLPRALVEAMSRALPALGTDTGGIPELLGRQQLCKRSGDIAAQLATKIGELDSEKMRILAKENFKRSKDYDGTTLDEKRIAFLKEFAI
jgi:glycosyltransferase involved in cell wall biosynthesis